MSREPRDVWEAFAVVGVREAWQRQHAKRRRQLIAAIIGAYRDGTEIAGWLSDALGEAAVRVGGVDVLLHRRSGSWEADLVDRLAFTLGREKETREGPLDARNCDGLTRADGRSCFICGGHNSINDEGFSDD